MHAPRQHITSQRAHVAPPRPVPPATYAPPRPRSTAVLLAWVVYYWVLVVTVALQEGAWDFDQWDLADPSASAHHDLNNLASWANFYSAWLYMGIVVDFLICLRIARYMRIHVGLKAFYQARAGRAGGRARVTCLCAVLCVCMRVHVCACLYVHVSARDAA